MVSSRKMVINKITICEIVYGRINIAACLSVRVPSTWPNGTHKRRKSTNLPWRPVTVRRRGGLPASGIIPGAFPFLPGAFLPFLAILIPIVRKQLCRPRPNQARNGTLS